MTEEIRRSLGARIRDRRLARFNTKIAAYTEAGVNSATWDRAEAGEPLRADRLRSIIRVLWPESEGDWQSVVGLNDNEHEAAVTADDGVNVPRGILAPDRFADQDLAISFGSVIEFANLCRTRGANAKLVANFIQSAVTVADSASVAQLQHAVAVATRPPRSNDEGESDAQAPEPEQDQGSSPSGGAAGSPAGRGTAIGESTQADEDHAPPKGRASSAGDPPPAKKTRAAQIARAAGHGMQRRSDGAEDETGRAVGSD